MNSAVQRPGSSTQANAYLQIKDVKVCKGAVGAYLGLLSGLRRPPDLGYQYRRILPEKVANRTRKAQLFYSSSHLGRFGQQNHQFGNFSLALSEMAQRLLSRQNDLLQIFDRQSPLVERYVVKFLRSEVASLFRLIFLPQRPPLTPTDEVRRQLRRS